MTDSRQSGVIDDDGGEQVLRNRIDEHQLAGIACVLVGVSQLPLAFVYAESTPSLFVVGAGGWMLIGIGINLLQGRAAFEIEWADDETISWLIAAVLVVLSIGVVVAAGLAISSA